MAPKEVFVFILFVLCAERTFSKALHEKSTKHHPNHVEASINRDECESFNCSPGQECAINGEGQPYCECSSACPDHFKPVCGSDGQFYLNHCELHRSSCVTKKRIKVSWQTDCFEISELNALYSSSSSKTTTPSTPPFSPSTSALPPKGEADLQHLPRSRKKESKSKKPLCLEQDFENFLAKLLDFHRKKNFNGPTKDELVIDLMFRTYDINNDDHLDSMELTSAQEREHLQLLSISCDLAEMTRWNDQDGDGLLDKGEFYQAYGAAPVSIDRHLKTVVTVASVGDHIELKCDVKGTSGSQEYTWLRNGVDLKPIRGQDVTAFDRGTLLFSGVDLHHHGNYTCNAVDDDQLMQMHVLRVQMAPKVRVIPASQTTKPGSDVNMKCWPLGIPEPKVSWLKNGVHLESKAGQLWRVNGFQTELVLSDVTTSQTGSYSCFAENGAGSASDASFVIVGEPISITLQGAFYVFHENGISVSSDSSCQELKRITPSDVVKGSSQMLCGQQVACRWGSVANVNNKFLYATQPDLNRVVVIDLYSQSLSELVTTDPRPVEIFYDRSQDQIWVLCYGDVDSSPAKSVVILKDASILRRHSAIHTQPVDDRFDMVKSVFVPTSFEMDYKWRYAIALHYDSSTVHKIELESLKYATNIDLSTHECMPKHVEFLPIGGRAMVLCEHVIRSEEEFLLMLDLVTDIVLERLDHRGIPRLSPDGKVLVAVDREQSSIAVLKMDSDGKANFAFNVRTNLKPSDVAFFPSDGRNYDLFVSSMERPDLLYVNLLSGIVEMIPGVLNPIPKSNWPWELPNRVIVSGGWFGEVLATPAKETTVVLNGRTRMKWCEIAQTPFGNVVAWVHQFSP